MHLKILIFSITKILNKSTTITYSKTERDKYDIIKVKMIATANSNNIKTTTNNLNEFGLYDLEELKFQQV